MHSVVPHRFLFRYSIPVKHVDRLPAQGGGARALPKGCALPDFGELDQRRPFAELSAAWNNRGLGFSATVRGKKHPVSCNSSTPEESDGLQVWIDTRNTQSIHRASRFCHHFCFLPAGAGRALDRPLAVQLPIARAKEDSPLAKSGSIPIAVEAFDDGYRVDAWLPAEVLTGYDPDANPLIGFYYFALDAELGEQFLSVGRDFPFAHDPSLWSTLDLQGG